MTPDLTKMNRQSSRMNHIEIAQSPTANTLTTTVHQKHTHSQPVGKHKNSLMQAQIRSRN